MVKWTREVKFLGYFCEFSRLDINTIVSMSVRNFYDSPSLIIIIKINVLFYIFKVNLTVKIKVFEIDNLRELTHKFLIY